MCIRLKLSSISLIVLIFCLSFHQAHQNTIEDFKPDTSDTLFDIIVLSQEWPNTHCKFYKHDLNRVGTCFLPEKKNQWTVHGIWPRKGDEYPEFCNESWPFNPEEIKSIEPDLHVAHLQLYKGDDGESNDYVFWGHEWLRHGTCAASFEPFNTQLKYFNFSIEWNKKYYLSDMLEAANIYPSDTKYIELEAVVNAVQAVTKKSPMIGCYVIEGVTYLQEIRICLDKAFNVMDCNRYAIDTDCYSPIGIIYPETN